MNFVLKIISFFAFMWLLTLQVEAQKIAPKPKPARYMVDDAIMLTPVAAQTIEDRLYTYFKEKGAQIVVVTVQSLQGATVEEYAEKLFKTWGIGDKVRNDGVLLLISKDDRKMRIEVGYGMEATITDAFATEVINNTLTPQFKNSNFGVGIDLATRQIINKISPDYVIRLSVADSTRAANKQAEEREARARQAVEDELKATKIAAAEAKNTQVAIGFVVVAAVSFFLWRHRKKKANKAADEEKEKTNCDREFALLNNLKTGAAYIEFAAFREFVAEYMAKLEAAIAGIKEKNGILKAQALRHANKDILAGYLILAESYQKCAVAANFEVSEYYQEEVARVVTENKAALAAIADVEQVNIKSQQTQMQIIGLQLPSKKISTLFAERLKASAILGSIYAKANDTLRSLTRQVEASPAFVALITQLPQAEISNSAMVETLEQYGDTIIQLIENTATAVGHLDKIATTHNLSIEYKAAYKEKILAISEALILSLRNPSSGYNLDLDLAWAKSKTREFEEKDQLKQFLADTYNDIFKLLQDTIKTFNTAENLTSLYSASYTAASIAALELGIRTTCSVLLNSFEAGPKAEAFGQQVDMFNGIFDTKKFLWAYLVLIQTRSYSSASSFLSSYSDSSYSSSYSDYKPSYSDYSDTKYSDYSDYKDYSDYSDYSDSSYGGGSSGGGGASGGW
jgi:uncharacterized membrane protein YgcG